MGCTKLSSPVSLHEHGRLVFAHSDTARLTGDAGRVSWWPTPEVWANGDQAGRVWTSAAEAWFQRQLNVYRQNLGEGHKLNNARQWKNAMRQHKKGGFWKTVDQISTQYIEKGEEVFWNGDGDEEEGMDVDVELEEGEIAE